MYRVIRFNNLTLLEIACRGHNRLYNNAPSHSLNYVLFQCNTLVFAFSKISDSSLELYLRRINIYGYYFGELNVSHSDLSVLYKYLLATDNLHLPRNRNIFYQRSYNFLTRTIFCDTRLYLVGRYYYSFCSQR